MSAFHPLSSSNQARVPPWAVAGGLLLLAVGSLLLYGVWPALTGQAQENPSRDVVEAVSPARASVHAVIARRSAFPIRIQASGHLIPWYEARLSIEADGPVVERPVKEGDLVEKGDLLVRVDDRDEQIALQEARAAVLNALSTYAVEADRPERVTLSDTTELAAVRRSYQEAQQQFANGTASREVLQRAQRRYEAARVNAGLEREAVHAARTGVLAAEQAVARARLRLEQTRVRAPFDGRVANLSVEVGQQVSPGEEVGTLLHDQKLKVTADVLETDVVHLQEEASAVVHVPALGGPADAAALFEGKVWAINPQINDETGAARVTVALANPDRQLMAGLHATLHLETRHLQDRLVVPDDAVLVRQGRDLVFVVENGRAQWRYVDVGARSGNFVEITQGVQVGDTVAVRGHHALAHDAPVVVQESRIVAPR